MLKNLEKLEVEGTKLSQQQAVAIMNAFIVSNKMKELYFGYNDLFIVDSGLMTKAQGPGKRNHSHCFVTISSFIFLSFNN